MLACILEINKSERHPVFVEGREAKVVIHYALFSRVRHGSASSARARFLIFMRLWVVAGNGEEGACYVKFTGSPAFQPPHLNQRYFPEA